MSSLTTSPSLTTSDLEAAGLTSAQVARLVETRERYSPYHEFFGEREIQRLSFLRWQIEQGRIVPGRNV